MDSATKFTNVEFEETQSDLEDDIEFEEENIAPTVSGESDADIVNNTVGPENGAIQLLIKVAKREFVGQRIFLDEWNNWLIRAHSIEEFRYFLWQLAEPHIKRAIDVHTNKEGLVVDLTWSGLERPTIEDAEKFITFVDKKTRKLHPWSYLTKKVVKKWKKSTSPIVCIYIFSTAVSSKSIFELATEKLLKKTPKTKPKIRPVIPPAADGYSFRDEVRAIRETFMQMRDLMHILDNRIALLESKCVQTFQPEPMIPVRFEQAAAAVGKSSNADPLQYAEIMEEDDDDDSESD